jgi:CheY-like chemotaxis protein
MDCLMPEMDGYEAARRIRAAEQGTDRHVQILALTASAMEAPAARPTRAPAAVAIRRTGETAAPRGGCNGSPRGVF